MAVSEVMLKLTAPITAVKTFFTELVKGSKEFEDVNKKTAANINKTANAYKNAKKQAKGYGAALAALGAIPIVKVITLIVGAFTKLGKIFEKNEEASNAMNILWAKLEGIFNAAAKIISNILIPAMQKLADISFKDMADSIGGFFSSVWDNAKKYGKAILSMDYATQAQMMGKLWLGTKEIIEDVVDVVEDAVDAFKKVAEAASEAAMAAARLEAENLKLRRITNLEYMKTEVLMGKERVIMNDMTKSLQERWVANNKVINLIEEEMAIKTKLNDQELKAALLRKMSGDESTALLDEINRLQVENLRIQQEGYHKLYTANAFRQRLHAEQKARDLEAILAAQKEYELAIKLAKQREDHEVAMMRDGYDKKDAMLELHIKRRLEAMEEMGYSYSEMVKAEMELDKQATLKRIEWLEEEKDARIAANADMLQSIAGMFGGFAALAEDNAELQKKLSSAEVVFNTAAGAMMAIRQGGIAGIAQAIGIIAMGLAQLRNINNTDIPGSSETSMESGAAGKDVFTNLAPDLPANYNQEVRAYVVEDDLANSARSMSYREEVSTL